MTVYLTTAQTDEDGESYLTQWDVGHQFTCATQEARVFRAGMVEGYTLEGEATTDEDGEDAYLHSVPDECLQHRGVLVICEVDGDIVTDFAEFEIRRCAKPSDYVYTETSVETLDTLAADFEEQIAELAAAAETALSAAATADEATEAATAATTAAATASASASAADDAASACESATEAAEAATTAATEATTAAAAATTAATTAAATATASATAADDAASACESATEAAEAATTAATEATETAYSAAQWAAGDYYIGYDTQDGTSYVTFYDLEED